MADRGIERVQRLLAREDFRRNPVRAVAIRVATKLAPRFGSEKFTAQLDGDITIEAPFTSSPGKAIRYLGISEPDTFATLRRLMVPDGVFVDVGAHIGEYALLAAKTMGPGARVFALEPGRAILPYLERNVSRSAFANQITVLPVAVSNFNGSAEFDQDVDPGHSRLSPDEVTTNAHPEADRKVQVVRLDSTMADFGAAPNLVKIDVEGAEEQVIEGMAGLLAPEAATRPAIVFEYLPRTWDVFGNDIARSIAYLESLGYRVFRVRGDEIAPVANRADADEATAGLDLDLVALLPEHIQRGRFRIV